VAGSSTRYFQNLSGIEKDVQIEVFFFKTNDDTFAAAQVSDTTKEDE
jgi:hypothetical protein